MIHWYTSSSTLMISDKRYPFNGPIIIIQCNFIASPQSTLQFFVIFVDNKNFFVMDLERYYKSGTNWMWLQDSIHTHTPFESRSSGVCIFLTDITGNASFSFQNVATSYILSYLCKYVWWSLQPESCMVEAALGSEKIWCVGACIAGRSQKLKNKWK